MYISVETSIVLTANYPPLFMAVCFVIAFLGCYTATQLTEQIRISQSQPSRLVGTKSMFFFHSLAFGGVSTWIMHILSLSTSVLTLPDQTSVDVRFATGMTSLSLILVLVTTVIGTLSLYIQSTTISFISLIRVHHLMPFLSFNLPDRHLYSFTRSLVLQNKSGDCRRNGGCIQRTIPTTNTKIKQTHTHHAHQKHR